ncbi:MAG: helix-hairpin-helix domain-containing protein [Phycisphaerales bacterium]|nr:helix-hairpin-helix domain-containing protein [Phycisphaerales bacterium]
MPTDAEKAAPQPLAAAAKWGAIAVLGSVAIIAVTWVILTNRTQPLIVPSTDRPAASADAEQPQAPTIGSLLDLNSATAAQLEHLPGIGPALAARIIADRTQHGPYATVEQLDRVRGIGPKTVEKLRPHITVK